MDKSKMEKAKKIWHFMRPYKASFFSLFFCVTVISFIGLLYPYLLGMMVNEIFYNKNIGFFVIIGTIYVILFFGERLIHLIQSLIWTYLANKFQFDIRKELFTRIITSKASTLSSIRTGDFMWVINGDTEMFMDLIHMNIFHMFNTLVRFVMSVAFVFFISYKLAILMLILVPLTIYVSSYISKKIQKKNKLYREKYGKFISWVYELISGIREIQLLSGERNATRSFLKRLSELVRLKIGIGAVELVSDRSIGLISLISDLCLYVLSAVLIIQGEITLGGFVAAIEYFGKANLSLKNLNEANIRIRNNMVSINRVFDILSLETEAEREKAPDIRIHAGKIEYKNVSFGYIEGKKILEKINLQINPGEKVAIVGRSGVGKSTMISLLTGLYKADEGAVKIDGTDIAACSPKSLRKNIGIVQQENHLFDHTIRYNLMLANPKCTVEEMWEACRQADAADFIRALPDGMDTVIGKNGTALSGGQRQRIAIARIILKNPKILVFDEATSALDFQAEKEVQKHWDSLCTGRTVIIIAHRLTTILNSDRVAVLNEGRITACDHHLKLLKTCEDYKTLFQEQYINAEDREYDTLYV
jgi:ATP-binding cassette subfamily B protein